MAQRQFPNKQNPKDYEFSTAKIAATQAKTLAVPAIGAIGGMIVAARALEAFGGRLNDSPDKENSSTSDKADQSILSRGVGMLAAGSALYGGYTYLQSYIKSDKKKK